MKKIMTAVVAILMAGSTFALSLADARSKISQCIKNPDEMTEVMKQLSAEDQRAFLAEVNKAIADMPGSDAQRTAYFLNANHAALKGAAKGNLSVLVAESFATVAPYALPTISERFATDLFNRSADASKTYTDEQFTEIAKELIKTVNERMYENENGAARMNGAARTTFAIAMMVRASNVDPASDYGKALSSDLLKLIPYEAHGLAVHEWLPGALGLTNDEKKPDYQAILEAVDMDAAMVANSVVIHFAGPQLLESMLGDIIEGTPLINTSTQPILHATAVLQAELEPGPFTPGFIEPQGYKGQQL